MKRTEEDQLVLKNKLNFFLKGNVEAINLCLKLVYVAHLWDDLIDGDPRPAKDINAAFIICLIDLPSNVFFLENMSILQPIMLNTILKWLDSNELDRGSVHDRQLAFVHRAGICELFNICATIIGGMEWAIKHGPDMRRMYEEDFSEYFNEMKEKYDA